MSKNKRKEWDDTPFLKEETKSGILGIIFFALALFFLLASLNLAGAAGTLVYSALSSLIGASFFLIPVILVILGWVFFRAVKFNFVLHRLVAGLVFFVSASAFLNLILGNGGNRMAGGLVGKIIAAPVHKLFAGYGLVLFPVLMLIALVVMFDSKTILAKPLKILALNRWLGKKDKTEFSQTELSEEERKRIVEKGEAAEPAADKGEPAEQPANPQTETAFTKLIHWGKGGQSERFSPPPLSLVESDRGRPAAGDIKAKANIIKRTLANFGIVVEMDEVSVGPSITRYALKPAEGVKLSRIISLQNDLALALAAHPLRIEAPIPGRSLVGIEVPNDSKSIVGLASLLGSKEFKNSPLPLFLSLGRNIGGQPCFTNLAKAPHILIAGATGAGKSVVIHTFITSLLYRNSPDQLRFIMIDPKRVELTAYNKIPHLLTPVVTQPKKAILVLQWAIKEMERRYAILEEHGVRDVYSYHQNILACLPARQGGKEVDEETEKMPYVIIVIDELADIMSIYPRELEAAVVRLAQMSRAVGIHLILSTQRPSVEIITGLIKANISSRIALQVASQIDSRTILDMAGAEKLLGAGDLLYISAEMSKPVRLQAAFISEGEVKKVADYLRRKHPDTTPDRSAEIEEIMLTNGAPGGGLAINLSDDEASGDDELYEEARQLVIETRKASATYLQRKLRVGYARAARLLDMLEERGIIGPAAGARHREVYESNTAVE